MGALLTLSSRAQSPVQIAIAPQNPGVAVPTDFLGLSFEMQRVLADTNGWHYFSARNQPLIAMFRTLGIQSLRVGGNTADRPTLPTPTESDVDALFAFARAAKVKVIFTLRLNQGELAAAVNMANYISRHYSGQLASFAIGNEPNVFSKEFAPYLTEWRRYAATITAATNSPGAVFSGPGVSPGHETWSAMFATNLASILGVRFITQHDYPGGDARKATNAAAERAKILGPEMDAHYARFTANFLPAVLASGFTCRFEEANSYYDGGAPEVSDTFASALWALNYQWWLAAHGVSGINFHTGDKVAARDMNKPCRYAAFWTATNGYNVHPLGYALKLFALGNHGRLVPVTMSNPEQVNLAAYATVEGKTIWVTLINRENGPTARAARVCLAVGNTGRGEILRLTAPNGDLGAKTGIQLGGAEIQDNARWSGRWARMPMADKAGNVSVELPASSAALVRFKTPLKP